MITMADMSPREMFLKRAFQRFYSKSLPPPPLRFTLREYAYFPFNSNMMIRHLSVRNLDDYKTLYLQKVPRHVYYSSAFYRRPDQQPMEEKIKGWLGAELIFDLDSDHIPGAENLPYPEQLKEVKRFFVRLIDEFMIPDFGIDQKYLKINFSGGRGYHLHVIDPALFTLDSHQRREIVDYITGKGIDPEALLHRKRRRVGRRGYEKDVEVYYLPSKDSWGWSGKLRRAAEDFMKELGESDEEDAVEEIYELAKSAGIGWGRRRAERLYEMLFLTPGASMRRRKMLEEGVLDTLPDQYRKGLLHVVREYSAVHLGGETDEPVTTDTKRIIRVPGSLHGKSTLLAKPLTLEELEPFDPLSDAVVLPESPEVVVRAVRRGTVALKDVKVSFEEGEEVPLPFYAAAFLLGTGMAVLEREEEVHKKI
ncbi:MAG TPA: DNA primase catalytic subunit PriS [Euryarchaeota archaeon]|nr:MAG: DNA primase catalytic subunit PriS [Thermoplasmata archaeon]RLF72974.1 MAG: DNA primase catalytic subunit PriS [Thermoplasmata archaeon]HDD60163.1 DNA primase catalytic subunit PriS [Euryarchaeota archaeon]